jgi:hypothetical protein
MRILNNARRTAFLLAALAIPAAAQTRNASTPVEWPFYYQPNIRYEGMTQAERAAAFATLKHIEQIFLRIPELANPTEFVVRKQYFGGARPIPVPNGLVQYSLGIHFFGRIGSDRKVASAGCTCIGVTVNFYPNVARKDEQGRDLILDEEPGPTIPGAATTVGSMPESGPGGVNVMFTRHGAYPWEPVSREAYLRALFYELEGANGKATAETPNSVEQTPYEQWLSQAPKRQKERDEVARSLAASKTREEIAALIKHMEATERQVTEQLKAGEAGDRQRNAEASRNVSSLGDQYRAEIAAMSPEDRAKPARVEKNGQLLPVDATGGVAVLTPKLSLWRPRRSPVEVHSLSVSIGGSTGDEKAYEEVLHALRETFRKLDWAALKRIVDTAP